MNESIFFFFYNLAHRSIFFDKLVVFTAVYLPYIVLASIFIFLFFYRKSFHELFWIFFTGALAWVFSKLLKIIIHTPRPFDALQDIHSLFPETGYGFPSGHATMFSAIAIAVFLFDRKAGYIFIFLALCIGLARIVAGVHFPADILGGFIFGALVAYLIKNV